MIHLEEDIRRVSRDGQRVLLTRPEFRLVQTLVDAAPRLVSLSDIMTALYGENAKYRTPGVVRVLLTTIRPALAAIGIKIIVVRGAGYRLEEQAMP